MPPASDSHPFSQFLSKLGYLADANFVTHIASSHSHLPTNAKPGPSHFSGAYQDDKRASKKSWK